LLNNSSSSARRIIKDIDADILERTKETYITLGDDNMPIQAKWSDFTKDNVNKEKDNFGIYELGDTSGDSLYIGRGRVRNRLTSHFLNGSDPIPGSSKYRTEYTESELRCEQRERAEMDAYFKKYGKYPKYNQRRG